jgi:tetraacyldisaccharide 4'-kinase
VDLTAIQHRSARALDAIWYRRSAWRWLLAPIARVFLGLVSIRRKLYARGWLKAIDVGVPVVVVGNISVGGTGKTPLVVWLADALSERGFRVGVICRGHGGRSQNWPRPVAAFSETSEVGDEARLLARRLKCPVVAGPDRVAAAEMVQKPGPLDVIVSDDGLQHYRLERSFEIAVVDGVRGLGNGRCLPAGPLREPPSRLREVDAIVVNGGDWGHAGVLRARLRPTRVVELASGEERALDDFSGRHVHAVVAIGHPQRFFELLESRGILVEPHPLADHAPITRRDIEFGDGLPVLMTEKDAVKCGHLSGKDMWFVEAELEFAEGHGERLLRSITRDLTPAAGTSP